MKYCNDDKNIHNQNLVIMVVDNVCNIMIKTGPFHELPKFLFHNNPSLIQPVGSSHCLNNTLKLEKNQYMCTPTFVKTFLLLAVVDI